MKAIIYAGTGLITMATMFGLADYFNSKKTGQLDHLYKEEAAPLEAVNSQPSVTVPLATNLTADLPAAYPVASVTMAKKAGKRKQQKRTIRLQEFSRARIIEPIREDQILPEIKKEDPAKGMESKPAEEKINGNGQPDKALKPERRISLNMFSRAPLRIPIKDRKERKVIEPVPQPTHL